MSTTPSEQIHPHDSSSDQVQKPVGRLLVFMSAKGGAGSTTLATNFAIALAQKTDESTLLIDLDLPLGDAALSLGIASENSTIDALEAGERLDGQLLKTLLTCHRSGICVLAAPGCCLPCRPTGEGIDCLISVARQSFNNVVVDAGSRLDPSLSLFQTADIIYLVTQAGVSELRNTNRLITDYFAEAGPRLQIVLNRIGSHAAGISEDHVVRSLMRLPKWKIPDDSVAVREMQTNATPLVFAPSAIAAPFRAMAGAVLGVEIPEAEKSGWGWFS